MRRLGAGLAPVALFALLTAVMTWPQLTRLSTDAVDHPDVYFNMWRFAWVAHAVATPSARLLDANIFYPERRTLTFSDAMPVESALATPLLWAGLPPVLVHNLMLLAGIALSGAGMFVLARRLSGSAAAGVTAGFIFAFAPYRFEHYMHMELQWTVFSPWAFWALHRTFETARIRDGALVGVFVALQFLSSIYYGAFLATLLGLVVIILCCPLRGQPLTSRLTAVAIGGAIAIALAAPYALQYAITRNKAGGRPVEQVLMFSAKPTSYTIATDTNLLYGERSEKRGRAERRLFTGVLPVLLAVAGLLLRPPTVQAIAFLLALVAAFELSLGLYGYSYPLLYKYVPVFEGFRAPARFGIYVVFFLGVLAAYGHAAIEAALQGGRASRRAGRHVLAGLVVASLMVEYWVAPLKLIAYPNTAPPVYTWLAGQPRGVVAELPLSPPDLLPGTDPRYSYLSTFHWMPMINGYSGYYPPSYLDRVHTLRDFPADPTTRILQRAGVRYVILHLAAYRQGEAAAILTTLASNLAYTQLGVFSDGEGKAVVYRLK
jgi:hypothetical protein